MIRNKLLVSIITESDEVDDYGDPVGSVSQTIELRPIAVQPKRLTTEVEGQSRYSSHEYMAYFSNLPRRGSLPEELELLEVGQSVEWKQGSKSMGIFRISDPVSRLDSSFDDRATVKVELDRMDEVR